jgi:hypothetical protein
MSGHYWGKDCLNGELEGSTVQESMAREVQSIHANIST